MARPAKKKAAKKKPAAAVGQVKKVKRKLMRQNFFGFLQNRV